MKKILFTIAVLFLFSVGYSQTYRYTIDMDKIHNDLLPVTVMPPKQNENKVVFSFPKIIPGTYAISDFGKFIDSLKAFDNKGKTLKVVRLDDNRWEISNAKRLAKITYVVEDIFDTNQEHIVYPMAATNFEEDNVVINSPGITGFIEGKDKLPFELTFNKKTGFYASSSKAAMNSSPTQDIFLFKDVDELYDYPIMYGATDTCTVKIGNTEVLIAVYSTKKRIKAGQIANRFKSLIEGTRNYLGGKLPTDRYAFLYYIKDPELKQSFPTGLKGALEHTTSSFYYLTDLPSSELEELIVDISSHEFFHIITPLTIASEEVRHFNYREAVLSKHLWLYEGVTEYTARYVQRKAGIKTEEDFLDVLSDKLSESAKYKDSLSLTELSKGAAAIYADQFGNIYQKGALIAACLDIYLLHLSDGNYALRNLIHDLGVKYGKNSYFNDEDLFDEIGELTYPEIKHFLKEYVEEGKVVPYAYFFGLAGIKYNPSSIHKLVIDDAVNKRSSFIRKKWLDADFVVNR